MIDPSLLDRLRKADLATFDSWINIHDDCYIKEESDLSEAWLQHVLQEACQAKSWAITLTYNPPCGPEAPHWGCHVRPDDTCRQGLKADSPAEALLKAYLATVQG